MLKFKLGKKGIIAVLTIVLAILLLIVALKNQPKIITYDDYEKLLDGGLITTAIVQNDEIVLTSRGGSRYVIIKDSVDMRKLAQKVLVQSQSQISILDEILFVFLLFVLIYFSFLAYKKFKNLQNLNKTNDTQTPNLGVENLLSSGAVMPAISSVRFGDVAGISDIKAELSEIVDFLKNPIKYKKFGIKMPKGVLMVGPPGVGKTLVAKAVAGEANVPFFYQSGANFVQIYVGMGAKRVRELFLQAKAYAPSIIFIDEIDAVGKVRGGNRNDEREATLNQLLTEMDGFEDNSGIIVIAATNRIEMMDEALLRSGRFDRRIFLSMPDLHDRAEILKTYLKDKNHEVDINELAKISVGFSGAALATLVNEAAIEALKKNKIAIEFSDFENVLNKVLFGKKPMISFSEEEKRIQALYQGAKALSMYWFGVKFDKISLLQDSLMPAESELESYTLMYSRVKIFLSGMVALKITKNELFSNSRTDLDRARQVAKSMIYDFGMGRSLMPNENDVELLLQEAYGDIENFLQGMKEQLLTISEYIAENESIDRQKIKEIIQNHYQ
ncbi:MAG: AAA family ATPase [Campylobacter sp.]